MEVTEPISRKLIHLAKLYLKVLSKRVEHVGLNRYWYMLAVINADNGKLTQKALGEKLGIEKSAMVSIIDYLTEKGMVKRKTNPVDRREHLLITTTKGSEAIPEILDAFNDINQLVATDVSDLEMETFYSVLLRMEDNLKPFADKELNIDLNLNK